MIFGTKIREDSSARKKRWGSDAVVFGLTLAATAVMMLCPCDTVDFHDYKAITLVGVATIFGIAAAIVAYRRMSCTSGTTGFLKAVIAVSIVGLSVYAELFLAMEVVALMARKQ
jgi:hypothetical protein